MKTIAHVVTGLQIGGLERVVVNLVRGFRESSYRQLVFCLETGGPFVAEVEALGVKVTVLGKRPGLQWGTIRQLAGLFRQEKVTIVHTHNPSPHFHGLLAGIFAGVPVRVHTKHGRNYPGDSKRVLLYRALSWFTDAIVPVSDNAAQVALEVEKVNPKKVRRIWNGIDTELYRPKTEDQRPETAAKSLPSSGSSLQSAAPVIGTVARLSPEKDQETLLAAFKLMLEQWHASARLPRLVFVGDGSCMAGLREAATHLDLTGQVDFLGARSDVAALMPSFSIFTLSSITEGISMTILEAMACGVPIVASDVGGNREIVQPPACGLIVPPRDPHALAAGYLELLRDPTRRTVMGAAGRQRVIDHFSLESMCQQYAAVYEELLRRKTT